MRFFMSLEIIAKLSNIYGSDPDYVLAGGGTPLSKMKSIFM